MTDGSNVQKLARRTVTAVVLILGIPTAVLLTLWAISFIDFTGGPETCSFNSITNEEYQQLLVRAKAQPWTVWPDLSNGIIWPSIQPSQGGTSKTVFGPSTNQKMLAYINQLIALESRSADRELAGAHALMRSIGAKLVHVFDVRRDQGHSDVIFDYSMPQRRFAPLCLFCLIFEDTLISIVFDRDIPSGTIALDRVRVRHPKLDWHAGKTSTSLGLCPAFPPVPTGR